MASLSKKIGWYEWKIITQEIYLRDWKGWPESEMRRYHKQGLSPMNAYMEASRKRARNHGANTNPTPR